MTASIPWDFDRFQLTTGKTNGASNHNFLQNLGKSQMSNNIMEDNIKAWDNKEHWRDTDVAQLAQDLKPAGSKHISGLGNGSYVTQYLTSRHKAWMIIFE